MHLMILRYHPNATRSFLMIPDKAITVNICIITVPQRERSCTFIKEIIADGVPARFIRDDLELSIAVIKNIFFYRSIRIMERPGAHTNPDCFTTIHTKIRSCAKIIVVNQIIIRMLIEPYHKRCSLVRFALKPAMVDPVVVSPQ